MFLQSDVGSVSTRWHASICNAPTSTHKLGCDLYYAGISQTLNVNIVLYGSMVLCSLCYADLQVVADDTIVEQFRPGRLRPSLPEVLWAHTICRAEKERQQYACKRFA